MSFGIARGLFLRIMYDCIHNGKEFLKEMYINKRRRDGRMKLNAKRGAEKSFVLLLTMLCGMCLKATLIVT